MGTQTLCKAPDGVVKGNAPDLCKIKTKSAKADFDRKDTISYESFYEMAERVCRY